MSTTKKQTMKQGTAMAKGASGPRAKFSAKKLAKIPAMMAEKVNISISPEISFVLCNNAESHLV